MSRLSKFALIGVLALGLAGCAGGNYDPDTGCYEDGSGENCNQNGTAPGESEEAVDWGQNYMDYYVYEGKKTLSDGRVVTCLISKTAGSIWCDVEDTAP